MTDVLTHYQSSPAIRKTAEKILGYLLENGGKIAGACVAADNANSGRRQRPRWQPASVMLARAISPGQMIHTRSEGTPDSAEAYTRYHYVMAALQELVLADLVTLRHESSGEINLITLVQ